MKRNAFTLFSGVLLAALIGIGCGENQDPLSSEPEGTTTPAAKSVSGLSAEGRYIVVFTDEVANPRSEAQRLVSTLPGQVVAFYEHALKGFVIANLPAQAANALENNPRVKYVEADRVVRLAQTVPTGLTRTFAEANANIDIDGSDDFRVDVDVAIIDTGIDFEHPDLNVAGGVNCATGGPFNNACGPGGDDDHYHGTHVGGTVGAIDNGIGVVGMAPGARLWAVKVLNKRGSGYTSWIVAGIDWVAANASTIEVANMSLGGPGFSQAEYDAIQGAVNAGVAFAVSAGNENENANNYSPAAFNNVLTTSALADFDGLSGGLGSSTCRNDQDDTLADFSNWGSAVDIAAPGVCIESTFPLEQGEYGTINGTSMASPHVAGALALLASTNNPANATDVGNLYSQVINAGNTNWTDDSGDGFQEPLLDVTGFTAALIPSGGDPIDNSPSVNITSPSDGDIFDSGTSISFIGSASDNEDGDLTANLIWTSNLDGQIGTGGSFSALLNDGIHTITAQVTDSGSNTSEGDITITVRPPPPPGAFTLSVNAYKVRGTQHADLTWSGASANVDVYRDGTNIATTTNDGAYTDNTGQKGGGSATYQVCETGTATCSNTATAVW